MTKSNGAKTTYIPTEFKFYAPKEKTTIGQFFHNSKDGTYFGRTPKSWGQLMFFYGVFYIVLAGLFTICMQGLLSTVEEREPKWKLEKSLIGTNPGLGFRPISNETEFGSVIKFSSIKDGEKNYWIGLLDNFMKTYNETNNNRKPCSFNETHNPSVVCDVDIKKFGDCSPEKQYGFENSRPCIFLKLNKIYDWEPEYYDNPAELPDEMPADLKQHISTLNQLERQQVWVSCNGTNAKDQERLGAVQFYPSQGFPAYYYPYRNQPEYMSPLIAVQFENITVNEMVNVECRAWAKNIIYNGSVRDRKGSVTFQIWIDRPVNTTHTF